MRLGEECRNDIVSKLWMKVYSNIVILELLNQFYFECIINIIIHKIMVIEETGVELYSCICSFHVMNVIIASVNAIVILTLIIIIADVIHIISML
jgi:hypothetical protein